MEATYVAAMDDAQEYGEGRTMVRDTDPSIVSTFWVPLAGWCRKLRESSEAETVLRNLPREKAWALQCEAALLDDSDGTARDDVKGDKGTIDMRAARGDSTTGIETNYDPIAPALAAIGAHNPDGTSAPMGSATFWQAAQDGLSSMRGPRRSIGQFTHVWRTWEAPQDVRVYHECASGERVLVRTFTPSPVERSADIRAYAARVARVRRQGTRAAQVWAATASEYRHKRTAIRRVKWAATVTPESRAARNAALNAKATPESRAADALRKRNERAAKVAKANTAQSYY